MLLALAGAVFLLSGAVAKAETVSYNMSTGNFTTRTQNTGMGGNGDPYAGANNPGGSTTEIEHYANSTWGPEVAVASFRTLTGSASGGTARDLKVGDIFTITSYVGANPNAAGTIGISFNDGTSSSTFSNYNSGSLAQFVIYDGGAWKVNSNSGISEATGLGAGSDRTFTIKVTSDRTFNATIGNQNFYDLTFGGGSAATIDSFALWSTVGSDGNGWKTDNPNSYWKNASLQNSGTVELGYAAGNGVTRTFSGVISDGQALSSASATANTVFVGGDAGSQVNLAANNSYTGTTTINNNATAELQHANALGSTSAGTTVSSGGALKLYNATGISFASEALTLNGVGISGTPGALLNTGGNNTWNGAITAGSNTRINASAGSLNIAGGVSGGNNVLFVGTDGGSITISSAITGSGNTQDGTATSLFKDGSGTLTLTGNNNYSGDTRITAGALTVNSGGNLGNGNSDVYVSSGATLNVNTSLTVDSVQETGTDNGGVIALGNGATLTVDGENKGTLFQNSISGSGGLTMAGSGNTSLSLYGTQSYTGPTTVSGGKISSGTALASTSYTVSGGTMETSADSVIANNSAISISGTGNFSVGGNDTIGTVTATGGRLTVANGKTAVLNGNSSIGSAAKVQGAGTIEVGTTTANSGTLTLNSTDAENTSALSVASGGTLSGTFRTSGALTVDGVLAPGNSTGTSYAGNTTFLGGGNYEWEIDNFTGSAGTSWDFLSITGTLTISATSADRFLIDVISLLSTTDLPDLALNFNDGTNYSFAIATASGGVSGWAADKFEINTSGFQNAFTGTWGTSVSGNSLNVTYTAATAIPEPSVASMFVLGLSALLANRRRRS
jgi:autotransporter-associated beta strand protein